MLLSYFQVCAHWKSWSHFHCSQTHFLARRDECPESYCHTVGLRVRMHKNFNLDYNSWTTIGSACVFLVTRPFLSLGTIIFYLVTLTLTFDLLLMLYPDFWCSYLDLDLDQAYRYFKKNCPELWLLNHGGYLLLLLTYLSDNSGCRIAIPAFGVMLYVCPSVRPSNVNIL